MKAVMKLCYTLFTALIIPIYWVHYGPQNFLWLSDIGLFLTVAGLWLESSLLISIAAVSILPIEIIWSIDFFINLFFGISMTGVTNYMFNPDLPLYLRLMSLFHLVLPITWILLLKEWGYDTRAWKYGTALCSLVFIVIYHLKQPIENINMLLTPTFNNLTWITQRQWFFGQMIGLPIFVFWPMHKLLTQVFGKTKFQE